MTLEEKFKEAFPLLFENCYCGFYLPRGWEHIVWKLCERLGDEVRVRQVKSKFGGLRFYVDMASEAEHAWIEFVERMSDFVCDTCATTADVMQGRCNACRKK